MACNNICKLCDKLIISTAVNFDPATNEVIIALPDGCYKNCEKYCIVVAQNIPTSATISSTVVITIGTGVTRYQLLRCNCQPVTACNIRTRTKYSTVVATNNTTGVFRLLGNVGCCGAEVLPSLPVDETVAAAPASTTTTRTIKTKEVTTNG